MAYDEKMAERVRNFLSLPCDVVEKKLMGGLCFMVKGAMCCTVSSHGGLLIRVGAEAQEQALGEPHAKALEMGGRTMRGYVRVMPEGYKGEADLKRWIQRGVDFVETLDTEPATRKRAHRQAPKPRQTK